MRWILSREAQLFVGWVSGSVTHAGVGFHASTQPKFILYLIPPTYLINNYISIDSREDMDFASSCLASSDREQPKSRISIKTN
ncbi:MAG: hypothetical protein RLZZ148_2101 [Cyanobacteriota bacterium]